MEMMSWVTAGRLAAIPALGLACVALIATQAGVARAATPGIDTSYGQGGVVSLATQVPAGTSWLGSSKSETLAGPKGSAIVVSGLSTCGPDEYQCQDIFARRFTPSGALDGTYGQGGALNLGEPGQWEYTGAAPTFAAVDARGRLWVVQSQGNLLRVTRYTSRGAIDAGFGTQGTVTITDPGWGGRPEAILSAPRERTVIVLGGGTRVTLLRLLPNGRLDRSFGKGGEAVVGNVGYESKAYETTKGATLIVAAVPITESGSFTPVQRVSPKGRFDVRFARLERRAQVKALAGYAEPVVKALVPRPDGTIELLGASRPAGPRSGATNGPSFSLRLEASGEIDKAYGKGGLVSLGEGLISAIPGPDGSTLAMFETVSWLERSRHIYLNVQRLLPSGRADLRFGGPAGVRLPVEGGEGELIASTPGSALAYVGGATECRQLCESAPYLTRLIEPPASAGANKKGKH
jgi:uncharacterized delta-60 repeat protein